MMIPAVSGEALGRLNAYGPMLVKAIAVAWAAWVLAGLLWLLAGHDHSQLPAQPARVASSSGPAAVNTSLLAGLNLFGNATGGAGAQAASAPDTTLQLKLNGVFMSVAAEESTAIVSEAAQPQGGKLYHINDALPGGATLKAVYEDRILISRSDGSSETLRFEKAAMGGTATLPPPAPAFGMGSGLSLRPPANSQGPANVRGMLDQAAQQMADSPAAYLQSLGLQHDERGGYVVQGNAPPSTLQIGLQPGDRIVSVDGQTLGDPTRDRTLLQQLKTRGSARVEIQRGDQTLTIDQKF